MKKRFILFLFILLMFSQNSAGIDVVVMVDTSESMFPFFDDLVNYLIKDLLENKLHKDDHFYLLSFANTPETEISLVIDDETDIETVIERILLLNALGQYTDLLLALEYLINFTETLAGDKKLVLLLTDGIHDPPPGSPYLLDSEKLLKNILEKAQTIKKKGWDIHILQTPSEQADEKQSGTYVLKDFSEELEVEVFQYDQEDTENITERVFEDTDLLISPEKEIPQRSSNVQIYFKYVLYVALAVIALLLLYLLFRLIKNLFGSGHFISFPQDSGQRPLILHVSSQNSKIGLRNVHMVAPGRSRSVGGHGSTFLIYYVPVPKRIGDIHNNGKQYVFFPRRKQYLPDLDKPLYDCLNQEILAFSELGHLITFKFEEYISPLEKINNLMRSIRHAEDES